MLQQAPPPQQQQPPPPQQQQQGQQQQTAASQRVFTGTVTKLHDNFGFVDEDVFFQTSVVKGQTPRVNVLDQNHRVGFMFFNWVYLEPDSNEKSGLVNEILVTLPNLGLSGFLM